MAFSVEKEKGAVPETHLSGEECSTVLWHLCSLILDSQKSDKAVETSSPKGSSSAIHKEDDPASVVDNGAEDDEIDEKANHVHGIPMLILAFGLCIVVFLIG